MAANLPLGVAVEKSATEVYALEIWGGQPPRKACPEPDEGAHWNLWEIAVWSISALMRQQWERDLALVAAHPEVTLHHLPLYTERPLRFDDFSQAAELIAEGREAAKAYLTAWNLPAVIQRDQHIRNGRHVFHRLSNRFERVWDTLAPLVNRRGNAMSG